MSLKKNSIRIACALFISALPLISTHAETNMCDSAVGRICTDTEAARAIRKSSVAKLKKEISDEANANAIASIEAMKKEVPAYRVIRRFIRKIKIRNLEIMRSAKKRISDFESVVTSEASINKLKSYMYQSINESSFDLKTKENFKAIVASTRIGNFADYIDRTGLEDSVLAIFLQNACGADGMIDNAFATVLKGERYVLMCPGFLIGMHQEQTEAQKFNAILHAISHEMGHHIDNSKVGIDLYRPFLNCLVKNYPEKFNKSKGDAKFCENNKDNPEKCNQKVVESHAGELIADQWGIRATSVHARTEKYTPLETENMLVDSWFKLCGAGDKGIHPTGEFRMGVTMRFNPLMIQDLACVNNGNAMDKKPACTFDGEVAI